MSEWFTYGAQFAAGAMGFIVTVAAGLLVCWLLLIAGIILSESAKRWRK